MVLTQSLFVSVCRNCHLSNGNISVFAEYGGLFLIDLITHLMDLTDNFETINKSLGNNRGQ